MVGEGYDEFEVPLTEAVVEETFRPLDTDCFPAVGVVLGGIMDTDEADDTGDRILDELVTGGPQSNARIRSAFSIQWAIDERIEETTTFVIRFDAVLRKSDITVIEEVARDLTGRAVSRTEVRCRS